MEPVPARFALQRPGQAGPGESGPCNVALGDGALTVTPDTGTPLRIRFRELARWTVADHAVTLELSDGARLLLSAMGKRLDAFCRALPEARVEHFAQALLLLERGEAAEEQGEFRWRGEAAEPARVRLQRTSLVVFPRASLPFPVALGAIEDWRFDPELYAVVLRLAGGQTLELLKFGKRTLALQEAIRGRLEALAERTLRALGALCPDLDALALRQVGARLRDGQPASRVALEETAPGAWAAIVRRAFASEVRRDAADHLAGRAQEAWVAVKEVEAVGAGEDGREGAPEPPEAPSQADSAEVGPAAEPEQAAEPADTAALLPELAGRAVAFVYRIGTALVLEVPTSTESATYLFRAGDDPARRVGEMLGALGAIQFRREPISLPEEALAEPRGARYDEALRLLPGLRAVRAAFLGRAVHASPAAWRRALDAVLARA